MDKGKTVECSSCGHTEEQDVLNYITPCVKCGASGKFKTTSDIRIHKPNHMKRMSIVALAVISIGLLVHLNDRIQIASDLGVNGSLVFGVGGAIIAGCYLAVRLTSASLR